MVSLALTPIWSAVTKASAQKKYSWIRKTYKLFLCGTALCFLTELCLIPLLQWGVNLWLGANTIAVQPSYALVFVCSGTIFVLHNVNTSIGNGLSYFNVQTRWMSVAAAVFVPLSWLLVQVTGSWIGIVMASGLAILPYEALAPVMTLRWIKKKEREESQ